MKDLYEAIKSECRTTESYELCEHAPELHNAALRWAEHAIVTYRDDTLWKALAISHAIASFCAHLEILAEGGE